MLLTEQQKPLLFSPSLHRPFYPGHGSSYLDRIPEEEQELRQSEQGESPKSHERIPKPVSDGVGGG